MYFLKHNKKLFGFYHFPVSYNQIIYLAKG